MKKLLGTALVLVLVAGCAGRRMYTGRMVHITQGAKSWDVCSGSIVYPYAGETTLEFTDGAGNFHVLAGDWRTETTSEVCHF